MMTSDMNKPILKMCVLCTTRRQNDILLPFCKIRECVRFVIVIQVAYKIFILEYGRDVGLSLQLVVTMFDYPPLR